MHAPDALNGSLWEAVLCSKNHIGPSEGEREEEEEEEEELTEIENLTCRSLNVNRTLRLSFFYFHCFFYKMIKL